MTTWSRICGKPGGWRGARFSSPTFIAVWGSTPCCGCFCTPAGSDPIDTGDDPVDTGDDTGGGDTDDTDLPSDSTDEDLVRGLIAGEGDVDEVLRAVAWSDGFPVVTSSGKRFPIRPG